MVCIVEFRRLVLNVVVLLGLVGFGVRVLLVGRVDFVVIVIVNWLVGLLTCVVVV